jgi:hypothetical protein
MSAFAPSGGNPIKSKKLINFLLLPKLTGWGFIQRLKKYIPIHLNPKKWWNMKAQSMLNIYLKVHIRMS